MNSKSSKPVLICAFGLLAGFFMPWLQFMGAGMSGYNLGQLGSYGNYAWIVPILAGATILVSFAGGNNRGIGIVAGIVPIVALVYLLVTMTDSHSGPNMFLFGGRPAGFDDAIKALGQVCAVGVYFTLISCVAIIIAAAVPSTGSPPEARQEA